VKNQRNHGGGVKSISKNKQHQRKRRKKQQRSISINNGETTHGAAKASIKKKMYGVAVAATTVWLTRTLALAIS